MFAWLALRERITRGVWLSLLVGFAGVMLILHPSPEIWREPSALIALSAAVFSAIALVTINCLARTETTNQILFFYFFFSSLVTLPFALASWRALTRNDFLCLLAIGALMAIAQLLFLLAYHHASASRIAPFNYSVVVFSGVLGWIIWKDLPGWASLFGVILVSAGGILSTRLGQPSASGGHAGWTGRDRSYRDSHM
jgi:drug/metabolite transporter (DMT)-like permease